VITGSLGEIDTSEPDSNPATPEEGPADDEVMINDGTASIEMTSVGNQNRVYVSYDQIMTIQGFNKNADGSMTHFEPHSVRRAIGNFLSRTGTRVTFIDLLAFRDVARAELADNNESDSNLATPEGDPTLDEAGRIDETSSNYRNDGGANDLALGDAANGACARSPFAQAVQASSSDSIHSEHHGGERNHDDDDHNPTANESDDELLGDKNSAGSISTMTSGDVNSINGQRLWICKTCTSNCAPVIQIMKITQHASYVAMIMIKETNALYFYVVPQPRIAPPPRTKFSMVRHGLYYRSTTRTADYLTSTTSTTATTTIFTN
jgi:hypothetical protein